MDSLPTVRFQFLTKRRKEQGEDSKEEKHKEKTRFNNTTESRLIKI